MNYERKTFKFKGPRMMAKNFVRQPHALTATCDLRPTIIPKGYTHLFFDA